MGGRSQPEGYAALTLAEHSLLQHKGSGAAVGSNQEPGTKTEAQCESTKEEAWGTPSCATNTSHMPWARSDWQEESSHPPATTTGSPKYYGKRPLHWPAWASSGDEETYCDACLDTVMPQFIRLSSSPCRTIPVRKLGLEMPIWAPA
ncbi:hypothetical protein P7K49_003232 [Saguinus oedipus]|uniref:Uncharacterized protein n=1 Tax=Saguinus oedipus TaxID=9490 RepID=A0ABQ9WJK3_SAGOE|nr:hypothetical protein P7K49_003232 [Saguinus oedipus]